MALNIWNKIKNGLGFGTKNQIHEFGLPLENEKIAAYNAMRPYGAKDLICYAPLKNIYFGHEGKISACCYNRSHLYGTYPAQTVQEIWDGLAVKNLRKYIAQKNLNHGCQGCLQLLKAENYDASKSWQYDKFSLHKNGFPSVMEFELSNVCNLECTMCSGDFSSLIRKNREGRPPVKNPYDQEFVEQLKPFIPHLEEVKFYGGEPFLIEIYYEIWEQIIELNPKLNISIQTNATILNNRVKRMLEKANFHINVSIDSLVKETYESIRINAKFERVMQHIEWFYDYSRRKDTFFGISVCAMRENWKELPDFVSFCNDKNIPIYFHTVFFPAESALHNLPVSELKEIESFYQKQTFSTANPVLEKNKMHFDGLLKQIQDWSRINANSSSRKYTLGDLSALVIAYQDRQGKNTKDDVRRFKEVNQKIQQLVDILGPDYDLEHMLSAEDFENEMFFVSKIYYRIDEYFEPVFRNEPYTQVQNGSALFQLLLPALQTVSDGSLIERAGELEEKINKVEKLLLAQDLDLKTLFGKMNLFNKTMPEDTIINLLDTPVEEWTSMALMSLGLANNQK